MNETISIRSWVWIGLVKIWLALPPTSEWVSLIIVVQVLDGRCLRSNSISCLVSCVGVQGEPSTDLVNSVSYNLAPVPVIPDILFCCCSYCGRRIYKSFQYLKQCRLLIHVLNKECIKKFLNLKMMSVLLGVVQ